MDKLSVMHAFRRIVERGSFARAAEDLGALVRREAQMTGKHVRQAADLAATHRIGLARDREGRGARLADAPAGEMDVDDRIDLIGAADRLVDPLAE